MKASSSALAVVAIVGTIYLADQFAQRMPDPKPVTSAPIAAVAPQPVPVPVSADCQLYNDYEAKQEQVWTEERAANHLLAQQIREQKEWPLERSYAAKLNQLVATTGIDVYWFSGGTGGGTIPNEQGRTLFWMNPVVKCGEYTPTYDVLIPVTPDVERKLALPKDAKLHLTGTVNQDMTKSFHITTRMEISAKTLTGPHGETILR
jgi:hypothetical protein